jgi:hypothetical protein
VLPAGNRATQQPVAISTSPASDKWALTWYFDTARGVAPLAAICRAPCQDTNLKLQRPDNLDTELVLSYTEFV